jgi:ribonucleoside-diphosphate reductase beta chain
MQKVRHLIHEEDVDPEIVQGTLQDLLPLVSEAVQATATEEIDPTPLVEYATEKLTRRIEILTDEEADIPPVEDLVQLDDTGATGAAD